VTPTDTARAAGAALMAFAIAAALEARTFRVAFMTDPIGPRALPWLAAALVFAGGAYLAARPGGTTASSSPATARPARVALVAAAFIAYALLLRPFGFILATTLLLLALSSMFGGRPVRALIVAALFSGALYLLFAIALDVPLPAGALFTRG
jgi:putative tricarboxylic transport membrane protein